MPPLLDGPMTALVAADSDAAPGFRERLDRTIAGDMTALGELFAEHGPAVYRAAYRLTRSRADAEDITQELFVKLAGSLRGFTGTALNFPGWIRRVAVRQALMHMRGGRRRREVSEDQLDRLFAAPDSAVDRLSIASALMRLPADHRAVFVLKEVEGYDHAEIAELLNISVGNSEVRLHRARRQLRELLGGSRG